MTLPAMLPLPPRLAPLSTMTLLLPVALPDRLLTLRVPPLTRVLPL